MTDYMFNPNTSLFLRGLSLFHGWLPFLLLYLVWKLGYDRRALPPGRCCLGADPGLLLLHAAAAPDAGLTPVNINYVWGLSDRAADLGAALSLARRNDDTDAGHRPRDPFSPGPLRPQATPKAAAKAPA